MDCDISGEQLWSWIDRDAPELDRHLAVCPTCRARAAKIRDEIKQLAHDEAFRLPVPEKIGSYTIIRLIGEGGQALVYEAEQLSPRRRVALKVLKGGHLVGKKDIRHFRRESQALGRLNHPSIATIYESGRTQEGLHFFAMELVEGLPLHTFVKEKNPKQEELLDIFRKLCDAVQFAHDNGVIHRDLKPSNIMIDKNGSPKILDFGLARLTRGEYGTLMTATRVGSVEGTPRYMSPEQALGRTNEIDARTDVYSLGVVIYEILTGQPPSRVTIISPDTIRTICEQLPAKPTDVAPHLNAGLDAILLKALEKIPDDRYQSAAELCEDLGRYSRGEPVLASPPGRFYVLRKRVSRRRLPLGIAALGLVAIAAVAIWFLGQDGSDPVPLRRAILEYKYRMFQDGASEIDYYQAKEAPRRFPGSPEAIVVAAQAHCLTRGQNVALGLLFHAQERYPDYWPYEALISEIRAWQRPGGAALADTSYWNADLALSADAWFERSLATLDMSNALSWAQRALERDPKHELALTTVAMVSEIMGDPERAIATAQVLIETYPNLVNKWMPFRARLFVHMGRLEDALDETLEWQEISPDYYYTYLLAARVARRMNRFTDAERYFTLAIEKQGPDDPQATWLYFHRGTTRWLVGRKEDAISDYRRAWSGLTYPTYGNARLFILLEETGHHDEAVLSLEEARKSKDVDPWLRRIFDCLAGDLTPGELATIGESERNPIETCEGYYYAGEASLLQGFTDEAAMWFRKCLDTGIETDPNDPTESVSEYELARERLKELNGVAHASETTTSP